MTKLYQSIIMASLFLSATILISSCARSPTMVDKGIEREILYIGNGVEPEDLDPHVITGVQEYHIVSSLLEGLVLLDPADLHPIPGAARSWESTPDGLTYTFHLRSDARWSNGDRVTAGDFVFSYKRILTPSIASEYSYMLYPMIGAEDYNKGRSRDFSGVGVKALDDTTLRIKLAHPTPYFLSLLAHHSWFPVNPGTIHKFGADTVRGTRWTRAGNFVGNGAFVLDKWEVNREIVLKKNPEYWDRANVRLNEVHFYPIDNQQTEERSFRAGELSVTTNLPINKIEYYRKENPGVLRVDPYLGTYFYLVNVTRPPLNDRRVRRALALAIDRKAIVGLLKGEQIPADYFTPPNTAGYTCSSGFPFDTTAARKLLADAGYPARKPFPPVSILYNTAESHQTIAQAVQQMWSKYLGINVTLVNQEWKVYLASTHNRDYDIARMGWIGDYNDPATFLDMWISGGGNNRTGWSNAQYDSLIAAASRESDAQKRFEFFQKAEALLLDNMPVLPVYFYTNVYLIDKSVRNWPPNVLNYHPLKFVYLEKNAD